MISVENFDNILVGTININSISPKFDEFKLMVSGFFDVVTVTETKLNNSFPKAQFWIDGFSIVYRFDRNRNGGGLTIYVRDDIPSKTLKKHSFPENTEAAFVKLNFRKYKWLLCATYRAPSQNHHYVFDNIDECSDVYSAYERIALAGDFNVQVGEKLFDTFFYQHELTSINGNATCYKNLNNPCCIDHILKNSPKSSFKTENIFTGL